MHIATSPTGQQLSCLLIMYPMSFLASMQRKCADFVSRSSASGQGNVTCRQHRLYGVIFTCTSLQEELFIKFAEFEEKCKEPERARAIYKYALDHIPKGQAQDVYKEFVAFEKQHGDREGIEVNQSCLLQHTFCAFIKVTRS